MKADGRKPENARRTVQGELGRRRRGEGNRRRENITPQFAARWRAWLEKAVDDPDALWSPDAPEELINELVERPSDVLPPRQRPPGWIDTPPPERDPELGIGKHVAWQSPLHGEAVRRALT